MNALDFVFIAILIVFSLRGFMRGLINEIFGFGSFAVSLILGALFFQKMADVYAPSMNLILAKILGFLTVFVCAFILMKLIQMLVKSLFSSAILNSLDKALGLLLGFAEGAAIVILILLALVEINPKINSDHLRDGSAVTRIIEPMFAA